MNLDFDLTEEQLQTREMVRKFALKEIAPHVLEYNREGRFPIEIVEKLKGTDLIGGVIPPEYGGPGFTSDYHVERYFREAKGMQIVEGTTQIHTILQAAYALGVRSDD